MRTLRGNPLSLFDHGVDPVLIAPVDGDDRTLEAVAARTKGYTYVLGRAGVTGDADRASLAHDALLGRLRDLGAAPPVVGFGIGSPEQVQQALRAGAAEAAVEVPEEAGRSGASLAGPDLCGGACAEWTDDE